MQPRTFAAVKSTALILAAVTTGFAILWETGQLIESGLILLLLWGIAPYICFFGITFLLERFTRIPRIFPIGCVIAVLMLCLTLLAYIGTLGDSSSPYYGFIFLVVPPYLFIGSLILLGISILISWLINKKLLTDIKFR
jgi:hypothetical protein